ncbi:MAG: sugar transferase [Acidobacteria bacterium]|nr:MAG: sugar transferase [Acidobacteriota bacterium]
MRSGVGTVNRRPVRHWWKRVVDVSLAALLLVLVFPLIAMLAAVVWIVTRGPVLYVQRRPGLGGRPFRLYKFRTMSDALNERGEVRCDAERLTRFGRWLRSASLDELPSLFNVLRGDMSLVGPRPLLMQYLDRYTPEQARRHEVRPGITGWAQVNGRNALTWEEKFKLDVWYVDHCSFWLDVKILRMTVGKVVRREGISAAGHVTMPEFMGTADSFRETDC